MLAVLGREASKAAPRAAEAPAAPATPPVQLVRAALLSGLRF
ncbi:MAG: hypothetical protein ABI488_02460 [Polyangiaceae bacterium]